MPALISDCDGVLADTERFGHLPSFNRMFEDFDLPVRWSEGEYAELLLIGGGKERISSILTPELVRRAALPTDAAEQRELVAQWHRRKTEIYTSMVRDGVMPARPGVRRIAEEAHSAGWILAVASTSAEASVRAVLEHAVGSDLAADFSVFAGDVVAHKKPAPDIYQLAISQLQVSPGDGIAVEDSRNGMLAALAAGLRCVVTTSSYTRNEDFTGAALVVDSLGDPSHDGSLAVEAVVLADPHGITPALPVGLPTLQKVFETPAPTAVGQVGGQH